MSDNTFPERKPKRKSYEVSFFHDVDKYFDVVVTGKLQLVIRKKEHLVEISISFSGRI